MRAGAHVLKRERPRPTVRVVHEGFVVRKNGEIVDASSTVAVIDSGDIRIVVDTGSPMDIYVLQSELQRAKIELESVNYVVNTHMHLDHSGCNDLFCNATICAHALERPPIGSLKVTGDVVLAPGVTLVLTPGHTAGSISVFVESARRYAICGDAIPTKANYTSHIPPAINLNRKLAVMSMDRILSWADVVIPGHGAPFDVARNK